MELKKQKSFQEYPAFIRAKELIAFMHQLLIEFAWQSGETPPATTLITLIGGARRSSRSASPTTSSRLGCFDDESNDLESRLHHRRGDIAGVNAGVNMVRPWRCMVSEFSFDKVNAEPMVARLGFAQAGYNSLELRV